MSEKFSLVSEYLLVSGSGSPAFGLTITGTVEYFKSSSTTLPNLSGPKAQFTPTAFTPKAVSAKATAPGVLPFIVVPFSSKLKDAVTGSEVFSFAAKRASLASLKSVNVSRQITSAPYFSPKTTISLNAS